MIGAANPQHWQRVKELLAQVLEQPRERRHVVAKELSRDDPALREELLSLLAAAESDAEALQGLPAGLPMQALQARLAEHAQVGRSIGAWRIVSLIARGGMGEVYRAERADGQFEQQVAIKLLRSGFDREWLVSRFATERQILASLDHPNLARMLDGGTTAGDVPYFVMELVEGEPIDRYCQRLRLPLQDRLALFRTVCQVVGYAHSKAVVHRDLKADNILVTADGVVKLVDFGIAKQLSADAVNTATATAQRMMTLAYSSPEQVRGGEVTPASDVYSLGVVLYRLLTQTSPYGGVGADSGYELTRAICDTEPPPPSRAPATDPALTLTRTQRRRLRGDLDAVVMMALRKDPARRYTNAADLGDDVFRHMESLPVRARRGAWSYRVNRFVLRHRVVFGAAMLANLALVVGLGVAVYEGIETNRQRERAERHLTTVREFANVLIFDVYNEITALPGATSARKLLADKAVVYLEKVSADLPDDAMVRTEIAIAYRKLADIQGRPFIANLGDPQGALANYEKAKALLTQVLNSGRPGNAVPTPAKLEMIRVLQSLNTITRHLGRAAEAATLLAETRRQVEAFVESGPMDPKSSLYIAATYIEMAQAQRYAQESTLFSQCLDAAQAIVAPLASVPESARDALRSMAVIDTLRATEHGDRAGGKGGDEAKLAVGILARSRAALEKLLAMNPEDTTTIRDISTVDMHMAELLLSLGQQADGMIALNRALVAREELVKRDPANNEAKLSIAAVFAAIGKAECEHGQMEKGLAHIGDAIGIYEEALRNGQLSQMHRAWLVKAYAAKAGAMRRSAATGSRASATALLSQSCEYAAKSAAMSRQLDPTLIDVAALEREVGAEVERCK